MKIVVDTNIVFSALLSTSSTISTILFNSDEHFQFFACSYMRHEIKKHWEKLKKDISAYRWAAGSFIYIGAFEVTLYQWGTNTSWCLAKRSLDCGCCGWRWCGFCCIIILFRGSIMDRRQGSLQTLKGNLFFCLRCRWNAHITFHFRRLTKQIAQVNKHK